MRWPVVEHEEFPLAFAHGKFRHGFHILTFEFDRGGQFEGVRPCRDHQKFFHAANPRHDGAVVEAHDQFHPHRHRAAHALDDAHHIPTIIVNGHEIDHANPAARGLKLRFQDQRIVHVLAAHAFDVCLRREQPATLFGASQQRGKAGGGVKPRETQPIHRAIAGD